MRSLLDVEKSTEMAENMEGPRGQCTVVFALIVTGPASECVVCVCVWGVPAVVGKSRPSIKRPR